MYEDSLNKWGKPQEFNGIYFHPIKIKDEIFYNYLNTCLGYPKNTILDREISKASYLGFMINALAVEYKKNKIDIHKMFIDLLQKVTKENCKVEYKYRVSKPEKITDIKYTIVFENGKKITENEFEDVRKMILEQNGISLEYINEYHPELEKKLELSVSKKNRISFEEQLFSFCAYSNKTIYDIENYTFYQFKKHMERLELLSEYETFKPLEISGQISSKNGEIKHWLSHVSEKGRYDSILIKKSDYVNKNDIFKVAK